MNAAAATRSVTSTRLTGGRAYQDASASILCGGTLSPGSVPCSEDPVDISVTVRIENGLSSTVLEVDWIVFANSSEFVLDDGTVTLSPRSQIDESVDIELPPPDSTPWLPCGNQIRVRADIEDIEAVAGGF